jgi:hypothetical protein
MTDKKAKTWITKKHGVVEIAPRPTFYYGVGTFVRFHTLIRT